MYKRQEYGFCRSVGYHVYYHSFEQEVNTVDEVVGYGNLVKSLLVHELVVVTVMIELLVGTTFYTHVFQFLTDVETTFQNVAVHHVFQLGTHEGITLSLIHI